MGWFSHVRQFQLFRSEEKEYYTEELTDPFKLLFPITSYFIIPI
jgi:hypothetical protein